MVSLIERSLPSISQRSTKGCQRFKPATFEIRLQTASMTAVVTTPTFGTALSYAPVFLGRACLPYALHALPRVDNPQALDDLELAVASLSDVHVHSSMMLTGHHLSRTTRALGNLCVV